MPHRSTAQPTNRRAKLIFGCALALGACLGFGVSKARWNYFFSPPAVDVTEGARVESVAFARLREDLAWSAAEGDELFRNELQRCASGEKDCTFGRALVRAGATSPKEVTKATSGEAERSQLSKALSQRRPSFSLEEGPSPNIVVSELQAGQGARQVLISVWTHEVRGDDDHHGYAEWLLTSNGKIVDFAEYYYDIAGGEDFTPLILVLLGMILCAVLAGFVWLLAGATREVLTDAWR